jgi:hypothetical protein
MIHRPFHSVADIRACSSSRHLDSRGLLGAVGSLLRIAGFSNLVQGKRPELVVERSGRKENNNNNHNTGTGEQ